MARATDFLSQTSSKLDEMFQTRQTDHGTILARNPKRRGSGIDRATDAIGEMKLPAYKAQSGDDYTRITLYPKKKVSEMTREERIAVLFSRESTFEVKSLILN